MPTSMPKGSVQTPENLPRKSLHDYLHGNTSKIVRDRFSKDPSQGPACIPVHHLMAFRLIHPHTKLPGLVVLIRILKPCQMVCLPSHLFQHSIQDKCRWLRICHSNLIRLILHLVLLAMVPRLRTTSLVPPLIRYPRPNRRSHSIPHSTHINNRRG